jgi:large subunit ribosomal protein L30
MILYIKIRDTAFFMAGKELDNKLIVAVRVRGRVGVRYDIAETLNRLRLDKPNACALIRMNAAYIGMLKKCNNYIQYGEVDADTLEKLLSKHVSGVDSKAVMSGSYSLEELRKSMPFMLHGPRHGYRRSTKKGFAQGGSLGYAGSEVNELINRMV